jgi:Fe-S-cluster containining protein
LSPKEARGITRKYGKDKVYLTRWGEWRTRVAKGRCVMWKDNSCSIYDTPEYPAVCRGFPFIDAESGGPYEFDQTICPEFLARPELVQLGSTRRNGAR